MSKRKPLTVTEYVVKNGVKTKLNQLSSEDQRRFANNMNIHAMEAAGYRQVNLAITPPFVGGVITLGA